MIICPVCGKDTRGLYVVMVHGRLAGFECVPEKEKARYPKWEAAVSLSEKRSEIAKQNFHLGGAA